MTPAEGKRALARLDAKYAAKIARLDAKYGRQRSPIFTAYEIAYETITVDYETERLTVAEHDAKQAYVEAKYRARIAPIVASRVRARALIDAWYAAAIVASKAKAR